MLDSELITQQLCKEGYHIIEDFLTTASYQSLQKMAQDLHLQGLFKQAKIGLNTITNEKIRGDEIFWVDEDEPNPSLNDYLLKTKQLAELLNETLFLGLFDFETHFAVYPPGTYYKKHVDQFATTKDRKISCVYYLNSDWQEEMGGQLKLYNQSDELIKSITPKGNRFVCFNSELPHEVLKTQATRYSITGWFKVRNLI